MDIFEIKDIWGTRLWKAETALLKDAVERAVASGSNLERANLRDANLVGANLRGANLERANLRDANLVGANLERANLRDANLVGANLEGANLERANLEGANLEGANLEGASLRDANLVGANLRGANLERANLRGANLRDANLVGANLRGANLERVNLVGAYLAGANLAGANLAGANLAGANLDPICDDLSKVLAAAPNEVPGLLSALREGRVDGSQYSGKCACLVGTIANLRHEAADALTVELHPDLSRPAEVWFLAIREGDTPKNNPVSAITVGWVEQWLRDAGRDVPLHVPLFWRGDVAQLRADLADAGVDLTQLGAP